MVQVGKKVRFAVDLFGGNKMRSVVYLFGRRCRAGWKVDSALKKLFAASWFFIQVCNMRGIR